MATQTYMTAKLNLADGTIIYPQISLDNIVRSISDPTIVSVPELDGNSKVPIAQLPTTLSVTDSNTTVPTAGAVYGALNTKQNTLVEGDNIIHIVNGSTIMADITNLDVAGIDQTATNGVHLVLDGNTVSAAANLAANDSAGVLAGANTGVKLVDGVAQFDNDTAVGATPDEIIVGTAHKVLQADNFDTAVKISESVTDDIVENGLRYGLGNAYYTCSYDATTDSLVVTGTVATGATRALFGPRQGLLIGKVGSFLVSCEVYTDTSAVTTITMGHSYSGAELTNVSGASTTSRTTTTGAWVRLGGIMTQSGLNVSGPLWSFFAPVGTEVVAKVRNFRAIPLDSVLAAERAAWLDGSGYVYEPGDGVVINGPSIGIKESSVEDTLSGNLGTGTPAHNEVVTPAALKSALSTGQAVDCTVVPDVSGWTVYSGDGSSTTTAAIADVYRDTFTLASSTTSSSLYFGFFTGTYTKAAMIDTADGARIPLQYLFTCRIKNNGTTAVHVMGFYNTDSADGVGTTDMYSKKQWIAPGETLKMSFVFPAAFSGATNRTAAYLKFYDNTTAPYSLTISQSREFEVMGLTDDARIYLANPDTDVTSIDSFYLIKNDMVDPWVNIIDMKQATAVTLASGLAYKSTILSGASCTFSTDTCPSGTYGKDAHLTLFIGQNTNITFQAPLVLIDSLTPNSGHNITIKYRDGQALAYVDDTDIGYVVTVATGTTAGSLPYGLAQAVANKDNYIVFSHSTDNQDIAITGETINKSVNMIGNGMDTTYLSGDFVYATTNLSLSYMTLSVVPTQANTTGQYNLFFTGAKIAGVTCTCLSDYPSSVTFTDCIVTGNTFSRLAFSRQVNGPISGSTFSNNYFDYHGFHTGNFKNCVFVDNVYTGNQPFLTQRGGLLTGWGGTVNVENCYFNNPEGTWSIHASSATMQFIISGSTFATPGDSICLDYGANDEAKFTGTNYVNCNIRGLNGTNGFVTLATNSVTNFGADSDIDVASLRAFEIYAGSTVNGLRIINHNRTANYRMMSIYSGSVGVHINNAIITGNTNASASAGHFAINGDAYITGSTIANNVGVYGYGMYATNGSHIYVEDLVYGDGRPYAESNTYLTISGNLKLIGDSILCLHYTDVASGAVIDTTANTKTTDAVIGHTNSTLRHLAFADNVSIVYATGTTATVDAMTLNGLMKDGRLVGGAFGDIAITGSTADPWTATKAIFASPLDAHEVDTVKLSGTTFTATAKIDRMPTRIQLPASTTVSVRGNTAGTTASEKVITAPIIVIGDDPSAGPNGSATIAYGTNNTSSISGLGTYIAKDGSHDFTTGVTSVTTADGLGTALADGNKWTKLQNDLTTSATFTAATPASINDNIITDDYEPIFGGIYSVSSGGTMTVNEATKTATVAGGAIVMSNVQIPKGATLVNGTSNIAFAHGAIVTGGGTIDLNKKSLEPAGSRVTLDGLTITGGNATGYGAIQDVYNTATIRNCLISGNVANADVAGINQYGGTLNLSNTVITGNTAGSWVGGMRLWASAKAYITSSFIAGNVASGGAPDIQYNGDGGTINMSGSTVGYIVFQTVDGTNTSGQLNLAGYNKITGAVSERFSPAYYGHVTISSGAIVDLTDNANQAPIHPGTSGAVVFEAGGATVYPSAGSASAYVLGGMTVPQIGNTNVVTLGGSRVEASTGSIIASNCVISGGAAMTGGKAAIFATHAGTTVNFTSTTVTGCTVTDSDSGGAFYITDGAVGTFNNCVFSGNADSRSRGPTMTVEYNGASATLNNCTATQAIQCGPYGTVTISGGTVATLGTWGNATFVLAGAVKLTEVDNLWSTGNKVVISSGAVITLIHYIFHSGSPASIEVKTGGCTVNGHQIAAGNYTWIRQDGTFGQ